MQTKATTKWTGVQFPTHKRKAAMRKKVNKNKWAK